MRSERLIEAPPLLRRSFRLKCAQSRNTPPAQFSLQSYSFRYTPYARNCTSVAFGNFARLDVVSRSLACFASLACLLCIARLLCIALLAWMVHRFARLDGASLCLFGWCIALLVFLGFGLFSFMLMFH